jgi:hypothetical protein
MLLQSLLTSPEALERATVRQQSVEALVIEAGGIVGPGTLGETAELGPLPGEVGA